MMEDILTILIPLLLGPGLLIALMVILLRKNRVRGDAQARFPYRKDRGVCYIDGQYLVVNIPPPYRPRAVALADIHHVELVYDILSMEQGNYTLGVDIVKTDGAKVGGPGVVSKAYIAPVDPREVAQALEAAGLRVELPTGRGSILGNRPEK